MKNKCIVINGKFFSQRITGVQRFAREIVSEMDKLIESDIKIIVAVDKNAKDIPQFNRIEVVRTGSMTGSLWEQWCLPFFVLRNQALCVNLCNMAPILTPHIVAVHDVSYKVNKCFFSKKFTIWYNFVFSLIIRRIKKIITVSEFSKNEICRVYKHSFDNICVVHNGWQHFEKISCDRNVPKKYDLESKKYYFSMSSMAPNKNFRWIAEAAKNNPQNAFAVSGAINTKVFGDIFDFELPDNLKFLGYVSDEEAKSLMSECKAFLFPTYYEGFGIPPLEAISTGAKAVVSDSSCMREIFGNSVYYVDPDDPDVDLESLLNSSAEDPEKILDKYSWQKSAEILYKEIISTLT